MPRKSVFERLEELLRAGPGVAPHDPHSHPPPAAPKGADPAVAEEAREALRKLGMKAADADRKLAAALAAGAYPDSASLLQEIFRRND